MEGEENVFKWSISNERFGTGKLFPSFTFDKDFFPPFLFCLFVTCTFISTAKQREALTILLVSQEHTACPVTSYQSVCFPWK